MSAVSFFLKRTIHLLIIHKPTYSESGPNTPSNVDSYEDWFFVKNDTFNFPECVFISADSQ